MSRRFIDMQTYPRREHFEHFLAMDNPFFNITVQVDISDWLPRVKKAGHPFFLSFQYALIRAANRVPEFRRRIIEESTEGSHTRPVIVEYDYCNPSYTYGLPDGTYRYCLVNVDQPFEKYLAEARAKEMEARCSEHLQEEGDVLSLLFTSCVPWFSFTAVQMPHPNNHFSIPNIAWGRFQAEKRLCLEEGKIVERDKITIPVTLLANHALIDGIHVAQFLANLEQELEAFPC